MPACAHASFPVLADQWAEIQKNKELRCGTFADVPPFAAPDPKTREKVGFDVDMCNALAKRMGVTAKITPLSVEARVPEVKMGRVDVTVANLAYTVSRAEKIQFSDPYYLAKEMLAVRASDPPLFLDGNDCALVKPDGRDMLDRKPRSYLKRSFSDVNLLSVLCQDGLAEVSLLGGIGGASRPGCRRDAHAATPSRRHAGCPPADLSEAH